MHDSNTLLDTLKHLPAPIFEEVLFKFEMPTGLLCRKEAAQTQQSIDLIKFAEIQNRLSELAALVPQKPPQDHENLQFFLLPSGFKPNPYFTQRDEMLATLARRLQTQRRVALCGLGGMGKTQIALHYAYLHRAAYRAVLWVSADSPQRLQAELAALAAPLGLPTAQEQALNVRQVLNWLSEEDLMICDNADDAEAIDALKSHLPARPQVLLTSRAHTLRPLAETLDVPQWTAQEGAAFLWKRCGRGAPQAGSSCDQAEQQAALQLAQALDGLPLALDQAAAYIDENSCTFADYLLLYQQHAKALLAQRGQTAFDADHPLPVAATWQPSLEKIAAQSPASLDLLSLCAFLDAEQIPESLPRRALAVTDDLAWNALLKPVLRYSLLRRQAQDKRLSLHRLVQQVVRWELTDTAQRDWAMQAVKTVAAEFPQENIEFKHWAQCKALLPCAIQCAEWIEHYGLEQAESGFLLNQTVTCLHHQATYFHHQTAYKNALPLYQKALNLCKKFLKEDTRIIAAILNNQAEVYLAQGKYMEALPLFRQALEIREKTLGVAHPDVALSLNNLAEVYLAQGEYMEALPLFRQALDIREKILGVAHPDAALSLNNLAEVYKAQGQYVQALPLVQRSLAIREKVLGAEHPDVAQSLNDLAALHYAQGEYAQALPLVQRSLAIWERVLGTEHPDVASSLNNLAELYRVQGEYAQALPLYQRSLAIREKVLGAEHPDTAVSLNNLGLWYEDQKQFAQALPLLERAVAIWGKTLNATHPWTQKGQANLARVRAALERAD